MPPAAAIHNEPPQPTESICAVATIGPRQYAALSSNSPSSFFSTDEFDLDDASEDSDDGFGRFHNDEGEIEEVIYTINSAPSTFVGTLDEPLEWWFPLLSQDEHKTAVDSLGYIIPHPTDLFRAPTGSLLVGHGKVEAAKIKAGLMSRYACQPNLVNYNEHWNGVLNYWSVDVRENEMWRDVLYNLEYNDCRWVRLQIPPEHHQQVLCCYPSCPLWGRKIEAATDVVALQRVEKNDNVRLASTLDGIPPNLLTLWKHAQVGLTCMTDHLRKTKAWFCMWCFLAARFSPHQATLICHINNIIRTTPHISYVSVIPEILEESIRKSDYYPVLNSSGDDEMVILKKVWKSLIQCTCSRCSQQTQENFQPSPEEVARAGFGMDEEWHFASGLKLWRPPMDSDTAQVREVLSSLRVPTQSQSFFALSYPACNSNDHFPAMDIEAMQQAEVEYEQADSQIDAEGEADDRTSTIIDHHLEDDTIAQESGGVDKPDAGDSDSSLELELEVE